MILGLRRLPGQHHLRLSGQADHTRVDAQTRHEHELPAAVDERAVTLPGWQIGGLKLLFQAARRASNAGLKLLAPRSSSCANQASGTPPCFTRVTRNTPPHPASR